jgi:hypothetical protein
MEISESRVRKDMSFIEPQTKLRETLVAPLRKTFFGIKID